MGVQDNQPDWDKIAEKFDIWLPQLKPVGEALLETLQAREGERILDLGSGTGEPALTLARQMADKLKITGIDAAEGMVQVAQKKVTVEGLKNISFQTMTAEDMHFAAASFDRSLCRFGVMLFDNPLQGLQEMRRVLKPGGRYALAVWGTPETMRTLYWTYQVFKDRIAEEKYPPLHKVTSLGLPGVMEDLLGRAGFKDYSVQTKTFDYRFASFDDYWDAIEASDILKLQYDALAEQDRHKIRDEVRYLAKDFIIQGRLVVPHDYLLVSGEK